MKIYAIRDRLIDYFMQPFVGPEDKAVLASVARLINTGEMTSDIAQAPHQFEIWTLGVISEDGHITAEKAYLGDCSSLIRRDIRRWGTGNGDDTGGTKTDTSEISRHRAFEDLGGQTGAGAGPLQARPPGKPQEA